MIKFKTEIKKFREMGEKTGWSYIDLPAEIALKIKPDNKKSFRVKGKIDAIEISGISTTPMGEGNFIIALSAPLRNKLRKQKGDSVNLELEEHIDFKIEIPEELHDCLSDENLLDNFMSMPMSHRNYFLNWLNTAKTESTKSKRIMMILNAMANGLDFGEMIRAEKKKKDDIF